MESVKLLLINSFFFFLSPYSSGHVRLVFKPPRKLYLRLGIVVVVFKNFYKFVGYADIHKRALIFCWTLKVANQK